MCPVGHVIIRLNEILACLIKVTLIPRIYFENLARCLTEIRSFRLYGKLNYLYELNTDSVYILLFISVPEYLDAL
jgi:hypothetical protein